MGIKIPISQNIKHKYTKNKKHTYINKPVFVFIVILSSLIMYPKVRSISGCRPSLPGYKPQIYTVFEPGLCVFWFMLQ